jgi:hypothetical protein
MIGAGLPYRSPVAVVAAAAGTVAAAAPPRGLPAAGAVRLWNAVSASKYRSGLPRSNRSPSTR